MGALRHEWEIAQGHPRLGKSMSQAQCLWAHPAVLCKLIEGCLERRVTEPEDPGGGRDRRTPLGPSPCVGTHQPHWCVEAFPSPHPPCPPPSGPPRARATQTPGQVRRSPGPRGGWGRQEEDSPSHSLTHSQGQQPSCCIVPGLTGYSRGQKRKTKLN